jgi:mannose-1-phosphate guanylyltransferase
LPESTRSSTSPDGIWAVVLAGGIGSRFWPVSTRERPKQLLPLGSEQPLIVDTVERAKGLTDPARIKILAGEHLAAPFKSVLPELPAEAYWVEPQAKGTCPVLAWAAWKIHRQDPEGVMISLHSDHQIEPLEAFQETLWAAAQVARDAEVLVCVGAEPTRVEVAYGHVEAGARLEGHDVDAYRVNAFHEKPDAETAARYVDEGYLWNTGIFIWKAATFLEELAAHAPEVAEHLPLLEHGSEAFFEAVPSSVVDKAVMERSERVATLRATFSWDDVGSWEALSRTRSSDAEGNVTHGNAKIVDGSGNIVFGEGGRVVLFGVDDLVVVRTDDTTLVLPRDRTPDFKTLLAEVEGESS